MRFRLYIAQKLVDLASQTQLFVYTHIIKLEISTLSMHPYGSRVIQRMVERSRGHSVIIKLFMKGLSRGQMLALVCNEFSNHVLKKCLEHFGASECAVIIACIRTNSLQISKDRYGCVVLQRTIDVASQADCEAILNALQPHIVELLTHTSGNYVVQHILRQEWGDDDPRNGFKKSVVRETSSRIIELATSKIASNVIETILHGSNPEFKDVILRAILMSKSATRLSLDEFGNYVMRIALIEGTEALRAQLVQELVPSMGQLQHSVHGRKVYQKLAILTTGEGKQMKL
ncbi:putative mRNA-binding protein PUF3 [Blattamonas nauphoetae]|uniref:mRNA-binding protein PUF3 n=1 Tax=Blattamonas nauphoetae TaxID=2049346 RepID=A0ABQ9YIJ8_9EUKA|nr:putative mRNA-binding protein PUF3 [Blattamonas nauphoetae]